MIGSRGRGESFWSRRIGWWWSPWRWVRAGGWHSGRCGGARAFEVRKGGDGLGVRVALLKGEMRTCWMSRSYRRADGGTDFNTGV